MKTYRLIDILKLLVRYSRMELWYIYLPSLTLKISSHRNKVFIYKLSVTTVNFELNKLPLILLIIKNIQKIIYLSI